MHMHVQGWVHDRRSTLRTVGVDKRSDVFRLRSYVLEVVRL